MHTPAAILLVLLLFLINPKVREILEKNILSLKLINNINQICIIFIIINTIILIFLGLVYLSKNTYFDHIEPSVASIGWFFEYNKEIYSGYDDPERYALGYGPLVYLANYTFLKIFGPSIFSSKITAFVSLVLTFIVSFFSIKKVTKNNILSFFLIGFMAMIFMTNAVVPIGVRNDSLSYLIISISIFLCSKKNSMFVTILFGFLFFFQFNLKPHFMLSLLPPIFFYLQKEKNKFFINFINISFVSILLSIFLWSYFSNLSIKNYIFIINEIANNGFFINRFIDNFLFSLIWIIPILFFLLSYKKVNLDEKIFSIFIIIITVIYAYLGSRRGGGIPIFFSLLPCVIFLFGKILNKQKINNLKVFNFLFILTILTIFLHSSTKGIAKKINYLEENDLFNEKQEIYRIIQNYKTHTISMGFGSSHKGYLLSYLRPLLSYHKKNFIIDPPHLVETIDNFKISDTTLASIKSCQIEYIILPKNENAYGIKPWTIEIFDKQFIDSFYSKFERVDTFDYFEIWKCN